MTYYPDVGPSISIPDSDLMRKMDELLYPYDDPIENVEIRIHKLDGDDFSEATRKYHTYVILETKNWYYSIEKGIIGVDLQQSIKYRSVALENRTNSRIKIEATRAKGMSMNQLIDHIFKESLLKEKYDVWNHNCKDFAVAIFDLVQNGDSDKNWDLRWL